MSLKPRTLFILLFILVAMTTLAATDPLQQDTHASAAQEPKDEQLSIHDGDSQLIYVHGVSVGRNVGILFENGVELDPVVYLRAILNALDLPESTVSPISTVDEYSFTAKSRPKTRNERKDCSGFQKRDEASNYLRISIEIESPITRL